MPLHRTSLPYPWNHVRAELTPPIFTSFFPSSAKMPKEPRKRARKHRPNAAQDDEEQQEDGQAGPSWIVDNENPEPLPNPLDPELKAYFRSVDLKLEEWLAEDADPQVQIIEDQLAGT